MKTGKVYLIGAGPGDIELLTLKAVRALGLAEVVLIDDLVNREVLQFAPGARVIEVGKRGGPRDTLAARPVRGSGGQARYPQAGDFATNVSARPRDTLAARPVRGSGGQARYPQAGDFATNVSARLCQSTPQKFIERLMIAEAQAGRVVARVKGGDPFVFGRGGEEMCALHSNGITVEIVHGVTSGIAAPAVLGIPVTHRDCAPGVTLVTGHTRNGAEPNWRALAQSGTTLVIYMGASRLAAIVGELLAAGMPSQTPAAMIENATLPSQRSVISELRSLPGTAADAGLGSPAIVVIGEVAGLAQATQTQLARHRERSEESAFRSTENRFFGRASG